MSDQAPRKQALVTGASSGIGESFSLWCAKHGFDVVLVGRSSGELARVATTVQSFGARADIVVADLASKEGVETVGAQYPSVDLLILNAGITHAAAVGTSDRDQLDSLTYLMSTGVVRMCELLVPNMTRRGSGEVVIVSSIASFTPMRKAGPYAAAKSHATAYARSLAMEVRHHGVRVIAVCPGYVRTDLHRRAGLDHLTKNVPNWMWLSADRVVNETMHALARGKSVIVPGRVYRMALPFLSSTLAQSVWRRLTRRR